MYKIKRLDKTLKSKYPIIGHGNQGIVFKIDDDTVLKVYNKSGRRHGRLSDLLVAKRMEKLPLHQYATPFDIKTKGGLLFSYKMKRIVFDDTDVVDLKLGAYIDSLRKIREDTEKISSVGIQLSDLQEHNIGVSKGNIIIYDFSDYFIGESKFLRVHNNNTINDCFGDFCFMKLSKDNPIFIYDMIYAPFLSSKYENFEDYLDNRTSNKNMTVKEYVYSLKK